MALETKTKEGISNGKGISFFEIFRKYVIIFVFIICVSVFSIINPKFLTLTNILNILWQNSYLVVATLGMVFLIISGGVDLSAGFGLSFGGVVAATALVKWNQPVWVAVLAGIAVCVLFSAINGILAIKLKINSMMVTLATMTIYSGISNIFTNQKAIYDLPNSFKFIGQGSVLGVPLPAIITVIAVAAASFVLNRTYFGRYVYAVGGNAEAARLAGIKVNKVKMLIFIIGGLFFGIGAILLVSRTGSANASMAVGTEFTCITAAVLGGVAIQGGEGKIWSVVVAVFILGILANGMQIIGLGIYSQYIAKGMILLASIGFDTYQKTKAAKTPKVA